MIAENDGDEYYCIFILMKNTGTLQMKIALCGTIIASGHTKSAVMDEAHPKAICTIFVNYRHN